MTGRVELVPVRISADLKVPMMTQIVNAMGDMDPGLQEEILLEATSVAIRDRLGGFQGRVEVKRFQPSQLVADGASAGNNKKKAANVSQPKFEAQVDFEGLADGLQGLKSDYQRVVTVAEGVTTVLGEKQDGDIWASVAAGQAGFSSLEEAVASHNRTLAEVKALFSFLHEHLRSLTAEPDDSAATAKAPVAEDGHDPDSTLEDPESAPPALVGSSDDSDNDAPSRFNRDYEPETMGYTRLLDDQEEDDGGYDDDDGNEEGTRGAAPAAGTSSVEGVGADPSDDPTGEGGDVLAVDY
jgi:hypothetical protein